MNHFNEMMHEPDDDIYDDVPLHNERRLLTIGLYLSYLACLAGLLLIGNVFGQTHALFPDILGLGQLSESMRFALLIVPLFVLCACYIRLRRMTGRIMQLPERKLDERQRLIRDRAHRIAYRIITVLCLAILAYVCLHSMLLSASPPPTPASSEPAYVRPPILSTLTKIDAQTLAQALDRSQAPGIQWVIIPALGCLSSVPCSLGQLREILWVSIPAQQPALAIGVHQSTPAVSAMPADLPDLRLFYGLFLLTMVLIVKTLPTAIIGWKERG